MNESENRLNKELIELAQSPTQLAHLLKLIENREAGPGFIMDLINNLLDRLEGSNKCQYHKDR